MWDYSLSKELITMAKVDRIRPWLIWLKSQEESFSIRAKIDCDSHCSSYCNVMVPNWLPLNRSKNSDFFFNILLFESNVLCNSTMNCSPWMEPKGVVHGSKYKTVILKHNRYCDLFLIQGIAHNPFTVLKKNQKYYAFDCNLLENLLAIQI